MTPATTAVLHAPRAHRPPDELRVVRAAMIDAVLAGTGLARVAALAADAG